MDIDNKEKLIVNSEKKPSSEVMKKRTIALIVIIVLVVIAGLVVGAVFLLDKDNADKTSQVRDVFIIFMALETLVVGISLIILVIQLAILTNLIQNEVKPILESTTETVNNLKGTVRFLSNNLTEPVIKINQSLAMTKRFIDLLKPKK
jgi:NADH:ubiquinone oxidoreductase subunit 5 (subunit L)/multisubunit Na+/H+ antiporter MnhA subunit